MITQAEEEMIRGIEVLTLNFIDRALRRQRELIMDIFQLLTIAKEKDASDLHISVDSAPLMRVDGKRVGL